MQMIEIVRYDLTRTNLFWRLKPTLELVTRVKVKEVPGVLVSEDLY